MNDWSVVMVSVLLGSVADVACTFVMLTMSPKSNGMLSVTMVCWTVTDPAMLHIPNSLCGPLV